MITISKIPDGKNWVDAIAQYRSKGMRTNFYAAAEEFLPRLQWLSERKLDGGCYLFLQVPQIQFHIQEEL